MNNISLLLITKNESKNLAEWGKFLPKLSRINELIVVDDFSSDNTREILRKFSSKKLSVHVFKRNLNQNFSAQRNAGLKKCQNDWVFFLDADEIPTPKTINYLNNLETRNGYNYSFKRDVLYLGHTISHGQCLRDYSIRLFNKNEGKFVNHVHEIWQSCSATIYTHQKLLHYSIKSLSSFLKKINIYSTIRSQRLFQKKHHSNLFEIIFYPLFKFINLYFLKFAFLDGVPGLIFSLSFSLNSFLVRAKLWHLQQK